MPKVEEKTLTLPYIATVKNDKEVIINTKFVGKIKYIKNLGEKVKKGEMVLLIDDTDLKAKLTEIDSKINSIKQKISAEKINLSNLLKTHYRTKKLLEVKMASIEQYQNEESKIATLKSQLKIDKENLKALYENKKSVQNNLTYAQITSTIDGVVSAKFLNKDDLALAGKPILKITPKKGNYLFVLLPNEYQNIIYNNKIYPLTKLNATYNGLKTFKATVDDSNLVNGEKKEIKVVTYKGKGIFLPFDAILSINGKNFVFEVTENGVKPIEVKILASGERYLLIDKELQNPLIVAKPDILLKIKSGHPIKLKN